MRKTFTVLVLGLTFAVLASFAIFYKLANPAPNKVYFSLPVVHGMYFRSFAESAVLGGG